MRFSKFLAAQYRRPGGIMGGLIGNRMAVEHKQENAWSVILLHPQPQERILEVGVGPGVALQHLSTFVSSGSIVGVDLSWAMLHMARKRNIRALKDGRIELRWGDALCLPFADNSFDKVFSVHLLYYWPDPLVALGELLRVLRPGGLLLQTFLPAEYWPAESEHLPDMQRYSPQQVANLFYRCGCTNIRVERGRNPKRFPCVAVTGVNGKVLPKSEEAGR